VPSLDLVLVEVDVGGPNSFSVWEFISTIVPLLSTMTIASGADSRSPRKSESPPADGKSKLLTSRLPWTTERIATALDDNPTPIYLKNCSARSTT
jgi:hypothetical protein